MLEAEGMMNKLHHLCPTHSMKPMGGNSLVEEWSLRESVVSETATAFDLTSTFLHRRAKVVIVSMGCSYFYHN